MKLLRKKQGNRRRANSNMSWCESPNRRESKGRVSRENRRSHPGEINNLGRSRPAVPQWLYYGLSQPGLPPGEAKRWKEQYLADLARRFTLDADAVCQPDGAVGTARGRRAEWEQGRGVGAPVSSAERKKTRSERRMLAFRIGPNGESRYATGKHDDPSSGVR